MKRFWKAVLLTTLVAGTLDIVAAHVDQTIRTGEFPSRMFYVIAAGAVGLKSAFSNGPAVIFLGIFIHYLISFFFTLFFFLLYPVIKTNSRNKYLNGFIYAIFVWAIMNLVVLPLSALPKAPFVFTIDTVLGMMVLTVVFGIPISIMADRYYRMSRDSRT